MALDTTAGRGRPIVSYVRVGRGMVKVTKYENEQLKSPSETASLRSRSSSGRSNSTPTPGPSRNWLRRPRAHTAAHKHATSAHRSRSRSSGRSLQTVRRVGGYMHSDVDLTSAERRSSHDGTTSPARHGQAEPRGLFALNSLPIPVRRGDPAYSRYQPHSPRAEPRGRERRISPLSISPTPTHQSDTIPSPSAHSWTTDSEIDPAADSEMWSSISRLEDELVSRFGRGVVPPLTALRQEKTAAAPHDARASQTRTPSLPDELQRQSPPSLHTQSQNAKLAQRFHEPITSRRVHRVKSTPTLGFPLPPPTFPDWVTSTPLPTPPGSQQMFPSASPLLRAKMGPPPPFAPPPNFPPPPPPTVRPEDRDTKKDLEALVALYEVLEAGYQAGTVAGVKPRSSMGRNGGLRRPGEPSLDTNEFYTNGPRRKVLSAPKPFAGLREDVLEEEESDVTPSGMVAHAY
ncbi:hypothetical protein FRC12_007250 [Ceratobasidium sp. 428]|nr:hypothetical protein FRC12_007250 [Ceratobasidium sp. 428]